ncbi:MAG: ABC transporter ATP-binding protein [Candidatus Omnitrophica bacterium]|nr:ABC transporter ATP-binding protein [Candidatus Omnitrophota bacterium]MCG2702777.1 ABC transporter ATP-binding protein [Candidatus Omnitrophota bacterium]
MIEARHLHKYYNTQQTKLHVLKGVSLKISKGEFVCILGASGAGKSTLLHLLGGLDRPTKGEVLLNGRNIYTIKDKERALVRNRLIGFVFQFYHLLPEFTALENIMLPGLVCGLPAAEAKKKAQNLLSQVGLEKRSTHRPSELSGGEQQRIAIARALVNEPEILLCDEPTGNLDSKTGEKICDLLSGVGKENNYTILIATHSERIAGISSRVLSIKDGQMASGV